MRNSLSMLTILVALALPTASGATTILQAGITDAFVAPTEAASPSASFVANQAGTLIDFDAFLPNAALGHTFSALPDDIVGATLELRLKATAGRACNPGQGCTNHTENDLVRLSFADSSGLNAVWARRIGTSASFGAGLVGELWDPGDEATLLLDLAALPIDPAQGGGTLNLLSDLNNRGFLDVFVWNDTAVDSLTLTLETAPLNVPEPASALLLGLTLTGMAAFRRPRA